MGSRGLALGLVLCICICAGCKEEQAPESANNQTSAEISQKEIDNLRSLPYASSAAKPDTKLKAGLVKLDSGKWCPGFTLYNSRNDCAADLVDPNGRVLHTWKMANGRAWDHCELQDNGDLLVVGSDLVETRDSPIIDEARFIMRLDWDGEVLWKKKTFAHHDLDVTPHGRIVAITNKYQRLDGFGTGMKSKVDYLTMTTPDGELVEEKSLYEALTSNPAEFEFKWVGAVTTGQRKCWDPLHSNSVEWMYHEALFDKDPIYADGNVLVCVRHQDVIAIINWERNELVWAWGPGEIQGPHDAQVLENGNILLFDNGLWRKWSRVIELDPISKKIVWEYEAANPEDFYTHSGGGCQRLDNGNTLITNSDNGHAFEVTPDGGIVWEYLNPKVTLKGKRLSCGRMKRYTPKYLKTIMAQL